MNQTTEHKPSSNNGSNETPSIFDGIKQRPVYYSPKAIRIFAVLFSVLFGSVLMAINFKNTDGKKGIWQVLLFGILYTGTQIYVISELSIRYSLLTYIINLLGAYILYEIFWSGYIGKKTPYENKSVLMPAIIGILITAAYLFAIFYTRSIS